MSAELKSTIPQSTTHALSSLAKQFVRLFSARHNPVRLKDPRKTVPVLVLKSNKRIRDSLQVLNKRMSPEAVKGKCVLALNYDKGIWQQWNSINLLLPRGGEKKYSLS
ncbi:hypothetical protein CEXT_371301 [Caerostris extrusa]|uniref:Uncharacterized protein n=1 Tax=Caerostris extrusa TaxID=172846 RepID=A0AAV4TUG5_CAEEX|nr:hypothetical protein CEXT_371301 [Caerostris extrusa]